MAKPIEATPILEGEDLVALVNDLKKEDHGKLRRQKALGLLNNIIKR